MPTSTLLMLAFMCALRFSSTIRYQCGIQCGAWLPIDFVFDTFSMFKPTALELMIDSFILKNPATVPLAQACSLVLSQSTGSTSTRRLLESSLDSAATDALSSSLSDLIAGISTSALSSFELLGIEVSEWWIDFDDDDPSMGVVPALIVNGSFSLDAYPFNTLGLHGLVSLSVIAYPWFGAQFGDGVTLSPSSFTMRSTRWT